MNAFSNEKHRLTLMAFLYLVDWHTNLLWFQLGVQPPDHMRVASSSCGSPRVLVSLFALGS